MNLHGKPMNNFLLIAVTGLIVAFIGWHFGLASWGTYTLYQLNVLTGQGIIAAGVIVIILEIQQQWYDE